MKIQTLVLVLISSILTAVCPAVAEEPAPAEKTLYERLGGEPSIAAVVESFVESAAADPEVNFARRGKTREWEPTPENVAKLKKHLTQFLSGVTGGTQQYEGKDMVTAHEGLQITNKEFDLLALHLKATLEKFQVPEKEKDELMQIAASTRGVVVDEKADKASTA